MNLKQSKKKLQIPSPFSDVDLESFITFNNLVAIEIVDPGVPVRTDSLTGGPLAHISFMLQLALMFSAT